MSQNDHAGVPTGGVGGSLADRIALLEAAVFSGSPFQPAFGLPTFQSTPTKYTAAGAINPYTGIAYLKSGAGSAMTLVAPVAGPQSEGGDDGKQLLIYALDAEAYVVTTPSDAIMGADDTATFGGAVGDCLLLEAFGGVWYWTIKIGVTLTEA